MSISKTAVLRSAVALSLALTVSSTVMAQTTTLQPTTNQRQTAPSQNLDHNYFDLDGNLRGTLRYAGANANPYFGFLNYTGAYLYFASHTYIRFQAPFGSDQLRLDANGATIGTNASETATRLTVNGSVNVTGNIAAKYQDVAEWVPSFGDPQPATVVVLSQDASNHVTASNTAYDTRVAGVISEQPGVILGEAGANKVQVATTGRVKVKVDATASPIKIGDLLVTSDKPGVAMKSIPVEIAGIQMHRPGTLVGKALESLETGTGEILVLLSLQ